MKFLLDLQVLQSESRNRGIGRYSRGLAQGLLRGQYGADASVLLNLAVTQGLSERAALARKQSLIQHAAEHDHWNEFDELKLWIASLRREIPISCFRGLTNIAGMLLPPDAIFSAAEALYDGYIGASATDIVHMPSVFDGFGDDTVVGSPDVSRFGPARAVTVYDLIPFQEPDIYLADPTRHRWYYRRLSVLSKADLFLAISEHTRAVIIQLLNVAPDRVVNIGADTDAVFRKRELSPPSQASLMARYGLSKPFLMHVGMLEERKNLITLVRAFALLPPELRVSHELLIVADATAKQISDLRRAAAECNIDPSFLVFPGYVPDDDLVGLYGMTRALVMPSLTEGFGLPVLEAMRCGAPVLASNATSLPEVLGNRELLFDPKSPAVLAEKLHRILTDEDFRQFALDHCARQETKFSWERSASLAHAAFAEAVARRKAEVEPDSEQRQYFIVPSLDFDDEKAIAALATGLHENSDVFVIEGHRSLTRSAPCVSIEPENVRPSPHHRVIVLVKSTGLDLFQQAVISRMPAVLLANENPPEGAMPPEWQYFLEGYRRLPSAKDGHNTLSFDALRAIYPQVIGILESDRDLVTHIEALYRSHPAAASLRIISCLQPLEPAQRADVAAAIAQNHAPAPFRQRLLVDVSEIVHRDAKSGIQRVVKNVLRELLATETKLRIEPVYRDGDVYRYARKFTCEFLQINPLNLRDAIVDFHPSDTFLGLDFDIHLTHKAAELLRNLRSRGGSVNILVYDLLPLLQPNWFPSGLAETFGQWFSRVSSSATRLIAISRCVADDIVVRLEAGAPRRAEPIELSWYHNGTQALATPLADPFMQDIAADWANVLLRIAGRTIFLTVGTIEPRKGIAQLLDAADELWREQDVVFVLVGKEGWLVDDLISRIRHHPELNRRLFWFGQITDELLGGLYQIATAVILPSEAEGFGLPLIEAARRKTPILARDLPVFREVGREGAFYFRAQNGKELAASLKEWLAKKAQGKVPDSRAVPVLEWSEATQQLLAAIQGDRSYRTWP